MSAVIPVRSTDFYRPVGSELPAVLLEALAAATAETLAELGQRLAADSTMTRVLARIEPAPGYPIGLYSLCRREPQRFEITALVVASAARRQGFGWRLLGHALGLAESKGGRRVDLRLPADALPARRLCAAFGFDDAGGGSLRFELPPE